jgi:hypothetical protein
MNPQFSRNIIPGSRALSSIRSLVPLAEPGSIYLFQGERKVLRSAMQELVDRFAMQEAVQVIVGGNWISFDGLPLLLGERAGSLYEILDNISVSRAETCYQMVDTLQAMQPSAAPLIITDMLASFYEKDLTEQEVGMLLKKCLDRIKYLSLFAPVLIDADGDAARPQLMARLEDCADTRFYFQAAGAQPQNIQIGMPGLL